MNINYFIFEPDMSMQKTYIHLRSKYRMGDSRMPEPTIKDVIAKSIVDKKFRTEVAKDPTAAAESMNVKLDKAQAVTLGKVATKLTDVLKGGKMIRIDHSAVEGHGSVTW
jgi:hypothetical protein